MSISGCCQCHSQEGSIGRNGEKWRERGKLNAARGAERIKYKT